MSKGRSTNVLRFTHILRVLSFFELELGTNLKCLVHSDL